MRVAIHQPQPFPWLPYYRKAAAADLLVFLDDVQFDARGFQNRYELPSGKLTIPVHASREHLIRQVMIDNGQPWLRRHTGTVQTRYPKSARQAEAVDLLKAGAEMPLSDFAMLTYAWGADLCGVKTPTVTSSALGDFEARKGDRILALCQSLGATVYVSGMAGAAYLERAAFERAGIAIEVLPPPPEPADRWSSLHYLLANEPLLERFAS